MFSLFLALILNLNGLKLPGDRFPNVGQSSSEETYSSDALHDFAAEDEKIYKEYGFEELTRRIYDTEYGPVEIQVFQMKDFKAAFGIYTFFKSPQGKFVRLGDGGNATMGELTFWQDSAYVRIKAYRKTPAANPLVLDMARYLSKAIVAHNSKPILIEHLPETGLLKNSIRFFLGPASFSTYYKLQKPEALGFKDEVEVVLADYSLNKLHGRLLLLGYPDHPMAIHYFHRLPQEFRKYKAPNETVYFKRAGVLVGILIGNFTQDLADRILSGVTYTDSIKWIYDKRAVEARTRSNADTFLLLGTVVNSFVLTGLMFMTSLTLAGILGSLNFKTKNFGSFRKDPFVKLNIYNR